MRKTDLQTPFLEGGIRNAHYFNGRILTAEALSQEQSANRRQHQQLGRAAGEGVVEGLQVSIAPAGAGPPSSLSVQPGLAINRPGQALCLPEEVEVQLVTPADFIADRAGLFAECRPPESNPVPSGTGIYVFSIGPASGLQEQAPRSSLSFGDGVADGCDSRFETEGVRFSLARVDLNLALSGQPTLLEEVSALMAPTAAAGLSRLRNLLAHLCFGTPQWAELSGDAFASLESGMELEAGLLGTLRREKRLTDCDLPLGLLFWTAQGIRFVDAWSVRRYSAGVSASETGWAVALPSRQQRLREAMLQQFQEQVAWLAGALSSSQRSSAALDDYFVYLPPAGLLPSSNGGFSRQAFWQGHLRGRQVILEGREWRALLDASLSFEPQRVDESLSIRLFQTLENAEPPAGSAVESFDLFASPALMRHFHIPVSLRRGATPLNSDLLAFLFRQTRLAYQGLRRVILVGQAASRPPLGPADHLGLLSVQQVTSLSHSLEERARGRSLTQEGALEAFTSLADAQQQFTETYQDSVLPGGSQILYSSSFRLMIAAVDELLKRQSPSGGVNGLFRGLQDFDLFEARVTQRAINQFLDLHVGALPRGNVDVIFQEVSPSPFNEGDLVRFLFRVRTRANVDETYQLVPQLQADAQQPAWLGVLSVLDADLEPLSDSEIRLAAEEETQVAVQVAGVPPGSQDTSVRLRLIVRSRRNPLGLVGVSGEEVFSVGQESQPQPEDILVTLTGVQGNGSIDPTSGRVLVTAGTPGAVMLLEARFETQGNYTVQASIPDDGEAAGWVVQLLSPGSYNISGTPVPVVQVVRIGLQPQASGGNASLEVRVADASDEARVRIFNQPIGIG